MSKIDSKSAPNPLYTASLQEPTFINVPRLLFLMINGQGAPDAGPEFQQAVEALFSVSYALKSLVRDQGLDYEVMPLEALWRADEPDEFANRDNHRCRWTLLIRQPETITPELVNRAKDRGRGNSKLPLLDKVRFSAWCEGEAAQILHVGPFCEAHAAIARLQAFIKEKGYQTCGRRHEIYLSDPRQTPPAEFNTIIRQPVTLEAMR
ncbi:MAG: GyrI-like domain-containing protein [Deltaproteobacteria bacterium]|nr:GyrI-like domain-containing protein [Deltaproteobacteria bacterium]